MYSGLSLIGSSIIGTSLYLELDPIQSIGTIENDPFCRVLSNWIIGTNIYKKNQIYCTVQSVCSKQIIEKGNVLNLNIWNFCFVKIKMSHFKNTPVVRTQTWFKVAHPWTAHITEPNKAPSLATMICATLSLSQKNEIMEEHMERMARGENISLEALAACSQIRFKLNLKPGKVTISGILRMQHLASSPTPHHISTI